MSEFEQAKGTRPAETPNQLTNRRFALEIIKGWIQERIIKKDTLIVATTAELTLASERKKTLN